MKIQSLQDSGEETRLEDGTILSPPFLGALDGVSEPYTPDRGPRRYGKLSGGQVVRNIICETFARHTSREGNLEEILLEANREVKAFFSKEIPLDRSDLLPGCTFALAEMGVNTIRVVQGADSMAIWQLKDDSFGWTPNQAYRQEKEREKAMRAAIARHEGNRNEAWKELLPYFAKSRLEHVNRSGGYAFLNGQPWVDQHWFTLQLPRESVRTLLLFTDGFIPFEETGDEEGFARRTVERFERGGLDEILKHARSVATQDTGKTHIDYPEATSIAVMF